MNRLFYLFTFILLFFQLGFIKAQTVTVAEQDEKPLTFAEQMPEYKGGLTELVTFINENIKYPETALNNNVSGSVWVQFVVDKSGKLIDHKILKSVSPELSEEALRVLQIMPDWNPGKQNGRNVAVYVKMPIKFTLTEAKK